MILWETLAVAFSMFSAIPMPNVEWNDQNMRYSLCAFPLVGAVVGAVCRLWLHLALRLALPGMLRGAGLCVLPVLLTGGIHLDGYADTWDALSSHAPAARRQEILKDPHLGAFAAIRLGVYFVLFLAFGAALPEGPALWLTPLFCLSRSLSGLALTLFPLREGSGLARSFADASDKGRVRTVLLILSVLLSVLLCLLGAWPAAAAALLVFARYYRLVRRAFEGLSGDLAGWFLQTAELWMLGAMCLWPYVEKLL